MYNTLRNIVKEYLVAIYIRLSKEDDNLGESESIQNQKILLTKYVKEQGYNLVDIYIDDGYTGTNFNRPNFQRMLKDIEPLKNKILEILDLKKENYENPSIANVRELGLLRNIKEILKNVLRDTENDVPIDIINSEIKEAYLKTLSITGEDFDFDISKEIFSRFCVGK